MDGNNEPYREANWGRRYPSARCHEARRNNRGGACPLLVGIANGPAGIDHVYRSAHAVLDKGDQYAFGETDDDSRRKIESFAAPSIINFISAEERVYFVRDQTAVTSIA
jgi:hypothetical protein